MPDVEIHTDGSAIWADCGECGDTIIQFLSLPASLHELNQDVREHQPVCGESGDDDDE